MTNARTTARRLAVQYLSWSENRRRDVHVDAVVEHLDKLNACRHLAFSSLTGAVNAAARELGRPVRDDRVLAEVAS